MGGGCGVLNLHFLFSSEQAAIQETGIALIMSLQYNTQNMLAQAEGHVKTDGINELGPLQN